MDDRSIAEEIRKDHSLEVLDSDENFAKCGSPVSLRSHLYAPNTENFQIESFPTPSDSNTYDDYIFACKLWIKSVDHLIRHEFLPIPISSFYHRPSISPEKVLLPKKKTPIALSPVNRLQIQRIVLSGDPFSDESVLSELSVYKAPIPISCALIPSTCWQGQEISPPPAPYFFDNYEGFENASIHWSESASKIELVPFHPAEFSTYCEISKKNPHFFNPPPTIAPSQRAIDERFSAIQIKPNFISIASRLPTLLNLSLSSNEFTNAKLRLINILPPNSIRSYFNDCGFPSPEDVANELLLYGFIDSSRPHDHKSLFYPILSASSYTWPPFSKPSLKAAEFLVLQSSTSKSLQYQWRVFEMLERFLLKETSSFLSYAVQKLPFMAESINVLATFKPLKFQKFDVASLFQAKEIRTNPILAHSLNVMVSQYFASSVNRCYPTEFSKKFLIGTTDQMNSLMKTFNASIAAYFQSNRSVVVSKFFIQFFLLLCSNSVTFLGEFLGSISMGLFEYLNEISSSVTIDLLCQKVIYDSEILVAFYPFLTQFALKLFRGFPESLSPSVLNLIENMLNIDISTVKTDQFEWCQGLATFLMQHSTNVHEAKVTKGVCNFIYRYVKFHNIKSPIEEVNHILSLIVGPLSVDARVQMDVFRAFEILLKLPQSKQFAADAVEWMPRIIALMKSQNTMISSESWRILKIFLVYHLEDSSSFISLPDTQKNISLSLQNVSTKTILQVYCLIYDFAEAHIEADNSSVNQSSSAGFIFALPGIPEQFVKLINAFQEAEFNLNDSINRTSKLLKPEERKKQQKVFRKLVLLHNSHPTCWKLFNGMSINRKKN